MFDVLKFYYDTGLMTKKTIALFVNDGTITSEQYKLITGEEMTA